MNVASLDLCKELYELSGWQCGTPVIDGYPSKIVGFRYDLGFLLRKLPHRIQKDDGTILFLELWPSMDRQWCAEYKNPNFIDRTTSIAADTPEDAACKLAIELFMQNILIKETK